jgi:hypothetical protein
MCGPERGEVIQNWRMLPIVGFFHVFYFLTTRFHGNSINIHEVRHRAN